jgi:hypothetical protein
MDVSFALIDPNSAVGRSSSTNSSDDSSTTITLISFSSRLVMVCDNSPPTCLAACLTAASVCAAIKSRIASAWTRLILRFVRARRVNSPGAAKRAPIETVKSRISRTITGEPWQLISITSSPVAESGALKKVIKTSSSVSCVPGKLIFERVARRAFTLSKSTASRFVIESASGPLSLTTAIAPRPGGVDSATIVLICFEDCFAAEEEDPLTRNALVRFLTFDRHLHPQIQ